MATAPMQRTSPRLNIPRHSYLGTRGRRREAVGERHEVEVRLAERSNMFPRLRHELAHRTPRTTRNRSTHHQALSHVHGDTRIGHSPLTCSWTHLFSMCMLAVGASKHPQHRMCLIDSCVRKLFARWTTCVLNESVFVLGSTRLFSVTKHLTIRKRKMISSRRVDGKPAKDSTSSGDDNSAQPEAHLLDRTNREICHYTRARFHHAGLLFCVW